MPYTPRQIYVDRAIGIDVDTALGIDVDIALGIDVDIALGILNLIGIPPHKTRLKNQELLLWN